MKIFVIFVEPMLYGIDLIHEVYEKTEYEFQYLYCTSKLTGKDDIVLPDNAFMCYGTEREHKQQVVSALNQFQPDFAVINGYVGAEQTAAIRYCQKHHIPYAIESDTPLHIPGNKLKAMLKKIYLRSLLHHKYCYGFPGGTLQKENLTYYGVPGNKNFIMPMSISSERLLRVAENLPEKVDLKESLMLQNKKVFLFVGRLVEEKNVSLLIKAYEELKKMRDDIALLIVGDGPERENLQAEVKNGNIQDVYFFGYVVFPEIVRYYKAADFFVLPSVHEPWGLVVNEAMIMGLPVIVSSAVGCRIDLIKDGKNGFVFESGSGKSLIEKMIKIIKCDYQEITEQVRKTIGYWNYELYRKMFIGAVSNVRK